MSDQGHGGSERVRAAEVIAASCLATDLGMSFPLEHGLHATLTAMRLAEVLDVDSETASRTYYACLLMHSGCTTDAHIASGIFGGSLTEKHLHVQYGSATESLLGIMRTLPPHDSSPGRRVYETARRLPKVARLQKPHFAGACEVAEMLAERLGLPSSIHTLFAYTTERWDGKGVLGRTAGEEIPLSLRIVHVARDAAYQRLLGGDERAADIIRQRGGNAFDPAIATTFADEAARILAAADEPESAWEAALAVEPRPWLILDGSQIDRAMTAIGDFADLVSPSLRGHSKGVAELATTAAALCRFDAADIQSIGRAALLHDVGWVAVHPLVWQKAGRLTPDEWEQVRLHAYHTERVLHRSEFLSPLAHVACTHHERLDGSGYHRGVGATSLPPTARLLAAADSFRAMTEPRAHRAALSPEAAADAISEDARAGLHDPDIVAGVIQAAGQPARPMVRPAGLTEREAEVIGLLARGLQTKQVARALDISVKTADRHVQNAYRKVGVSTRAGATLFAMEHGMVAWGELPISDGGHRP